MALPAPFRRQVLLAVRASERLWAASPPLCIRVEVMQSSWIATRSSSRATTSATSCSCRTALGFASTTTSAASDSKALLCIGAEPFTRRVYMDSDELRPRLLFGVAGVAVIGVAAFIMLRKDEPEIPNVTSGGIYYTGPMKS